MNEIRQSRFRPVLATLSIILFFFSPEYLELDPRDNVDFPEIFAVIILISLLIFKIREKINIDEKHLVFQLHKNCICINRSAIKNIEFEDCFNKINIEINDSFFSVNVSQFNSKKIENFFTYNELYIQEKELEKTEYNQTFRAAALRCARIR